MEAARKVDVGGKRCLAATARRLPAGRRGDQQQSLTARCVTDERPINTRDRIAVTQTRLSDPGLLE